MLLLIYFNGIFITSLSPPRCVENRSCLYRIASILRCKRVLVTMSIIINEFLTFVQNKLSVLDELSIVQICSSNFNEKEIETGKSVLYETVSDGTRCVTRKGEDKSKKNIKDVIKLLKEIDPDSAPVFVAHDLSRLPAVSFDSIDVSRLLKDICALKNELQSLRSDAITKTELSTFETKLYKQLKEIRRDKAKAEKTPSRPQAGCIPKIIKMSNIDRCRSKNTAPITISSEPPTALLSHEADNIVPTQRTECTVDMPTYRDILSCDSQMLKQTSFDFDNRSITDDREIFTVVQNKKRSRMKNMRGTGTLEGSSSIEVAESLSTIYVSRLKRHITVDNMTTYIKERGQNCTSVELLQQNKETSFNSFKVTIHSSSLPTFLSNEFWPTGIVYRRFWEQRKKTNAPMKNYNNS